MVLNLATGVLSSIHLTQNMQLKDWDIHSIRLFNPKLLITYPFYFKRYIYAAKKLYGYTAELIVEEILLNGYLEMSSVLLKVNSRCTALSLSMKKILIYLYSVLNKFIY